MVCPQNRHNRRRGLYCALFDLELWSLCIFCPPLFHSDRVIFAFGLLFKKGETGRDTNDGNPSE